MKARLHKEKVTVSMTREEFNDFLDITRYACIYGVDFANGLTDEELTAFRQQKERVWSMICNILYR